MKPHDVQVRGAGLVGQALALSLARIGLRVALVADASSGPARAVDVRAFALNAASIALLRSLKVWDALPPHATTAVHDMHIEGDAPGAGDAAALDGAPPAPTRRGCEGRCTHCAAAEEATVAHS